jgi:hypothetical protein
VLPEERSLGKMRLMMGRKNGRQEHIMATLHSAAVQYAAATLLSVWWVSFGSVDTRGQEDDIQDVSGLFATSRKLDRRRILVTTTKIPMAKTPIRAIFCVRGSCSFESSGMGNISSAMSVVMFIEALKNQTASKLRQFPGKSLFQNLATGTQFTKPLTIAHDE